MRWAGHIWSLRRHSLTVSVSHPSQVLPKSHYTWSSNYEFLNCKIICPAVGSQMLLSRTTMNLTKTWHMRIHSTLLPCWVPFYFFCSSSWFAGQICITFSSNEIILFAHRGYSEVYHIGLFILILPPGGISVPIEIVIQMTFSVCSRWHGYSVTLFTKINFENLLLPSFSFSPRDHVYTRYCACYFCSKGWETIFHPVVLGDRPSIFFFLISFSNHKSNGDGAFLPGFMAIGKPWSLLGTLKAENNFWVFWFYLVFTYLYLFK
jgi:hypothetical protein